MGRGPRDPDKFDGEDDLQREFRMRFIPSGLDFSQRLFDAYAAEVARVDTNGDGVTSAVEGDVDTASDAFNDGLLAPGFAPSQRAWVLTGKRVRLEKAVPASTDTTRTTGSSTAQHP